MSACRRTAPTSERAYQQEPRARSLEARGSRLEAGSRLQPSAFSLQLRHVARCSQVGFTFIELMIVVSLLGIFFGAVYETLIAGLRTVNAGNDREALRQQLSNALDRLTREASAANNVDRAQDQRFQFDADLDGDGNDEDNINYVVQNGGLDREYSGDTVTLVKNVSSLDFDYIDQNGASYGTCDSTGSCGSNCCRSEVRVVQITITGTRGNESMSVAGAAYLRDM